MCFNHLLLIRVFYKSIRIVFNLYKSNNYSNDFYSECIDTNAKIGIKGIQRYTSTAYKIVGFAKYIS